VAALTISKHWWTGLRGIWGHPDQPLPEIPRGFRVAGLPVVAVLGIATCGLMIYGLGKETWYRLIIWLVIGLVFYFTYGKKHSKLNTAR